jgi:hypothetical protein
MSDTGQNIPATNSGYIRTEDINNRILVFDGTDVRMIIGVLPDGTIGIAISKDGEDVIAAFS